MGVHLGHSVTEAFDELGFIMSYEDGELSHDEVVSGMQQLINSGLAWSLQGHYGRLATALIEDGMCYGN